MKERCAQRLSRSFGRVWRNGPAPVVRNRKRSGRRQYFSATHFIFFIGLAADAAEELIERSAPVESADLLIYAFGSQQVAYASTRPDDAQLHAAARKVEVQLVQHTRAGEIDMG
jgi:hypothetical protein